MWQTAFDTPASRPQGLESRRRRGSCRETRVRVHPETQRGGDGPRGATPSPCGCEVPRMLRLKPWFQVPEETTYHLLGIIISKLCPRLSKRGLPPCATFLGPVHKSDSADGGKHLRSIGRCKM